MPSLERRMLAAIQESHRRTVESGSRSTSRLRVLHGWVIEELRRTLGDDYEFDGLNDDDGSKETKVSGWYYKKSVDVSVKLGNRTLGVVSVKFVNSNYKQNANNYFEQQMGEIANLRRNDLVFGHILCVTNPIPYYTRDGGHLRDEYIRDSDIQKYKKLQDDYTHLHAPNVQALIVFSLKDGEIAGVSRASDIPHLTRDGKHALERMKIERFFDIFSGEVQVKRRARE